MKKSLLAISLSFASVSLMAATSGSLLIKGTVPQNLSIIITPLAIASNLPLDTSQTDTQIATVNEKSNSNTGYKVNINSANSGNLKRVSGNDLFAYSMKYNGAGLNLSSPVDITYGGASHVNLNRNVTISYTGQPSD